MCKSFIKKRGRCNPVTVKVSVDYDFFLFFYCIKNSIHGFLHIAKNKRRGNLHLRRIEKIRNFLHGIHPSLHKQLCKKPAPRSVYNFFRDVFMLFYFPNFFQDYTSSSSSCSSLSSLILSTTIFAISLATAF